MRVPESLENTDARPREGTGLGWDLNSRDFKTSLVVSIQLRLWAHDLYAEFRKIHSPGWQVWGGA